MAYVDSYRKCDICGQKLKKDITEFNFRIEPKSRLKMNVWKYILNDPYDSFWTCGIDICQSCWLEMTRWINWAKDNKSKPI